MQSRRTGLWLVGAFGAIGSTVALGLASLRRGLTQPIGLVTALPAFEQVPVLPFDQLEVFGHDIHPGDYETLVETAHDRANLFSHDQILACREELARWSANVRPGVMVADSGKVSEQAHSDFVSMVKHPLDAIERIQVDLKTAIREAKLDALVVVNIASTEPFPMPFKGKLADLLSRLDKGEGVLPASSLYAYAALDMGIPYVNFTPSTGASMEALKQLAFERGTVHAGQDAKTGETLLKTVLAPMFAARNLRIQSWVGHNILGGGDGFVLEDPRNKEPKLRSKDSVLPALLGYKPQTHTSIEYIESMENWKTAWDHIHFDGFLGTRMSMQFTWQGCDAILAAPLVMDLARLTLLAKQRGEVGTLKHLACFFKSPIDVQEQDFAKQYAALLSHM